MRAASVEQLCAIRALSVGRRIRAFVQAMPLAERGRRAETALKPGAALSLEVDRAAEVIGLTGLEQLADEIGFRIDVIADVARGRIISLGRSAREEVVFAQLDAVDGTIKVGGLGNDVSGGRIRVANDGNWGATLAFTAPTAHPLERLRFGDFCVAAVIDGNPSRYRAHPEEVVTIPHGGTLISYDMTGALAVHAALRHAPPVFTSTNTILNQGIVYLDGFQAFDYDTSQPGDDVVAAALYGVLIDRHRGGAFDIMRQYGNLSAILHVLLGWRGDRPWMESQGAGMVVVNENLANLIPAVPIVAGATGLSCDFDGRPIAECRLIDGRRSAIHAANPPLRERLLDVVARAREIARHRDSARQSP